jgi:uncharacterized protein (TIGR04255 family)
MTENEAPCPSIPERRYAHPPVVEALCEIYFTGSRWDQTVPGLFYERVRKDYPKKSQMEVTGVEVQIAQGHAETRQLACEPRMRFVREDDSRLIQLGRDLLVVNQVVTPSRPYPHFEEWREVVHTALGVYRDAAAPKGIDRLGVRYINRVTLSGTSIRMEEFFRVYPQIPQELGGAHGPFMLQVSMSPVTDKHQLTLTFGFGPTDQPGTLGFLLDLYDVVPLGGRDAFAEVERLLDEAHAKIIHTFENIITDALREKFGGVTYE